MEIKPEKGHAICRACLSKKCILVHIDEEFVENYNIVTNLDIHLNDELPQDVCQKCWDTVHKFILFRKKCLTSELTLFESLTNVKNEVEIHVKDEVLSNNKLIDIYDIPQVKEEIKSEDDWQNEDDYKINQKPKRKQPKPKRLKAKTKRVAKKKTLKVNDDLVKSEKSIIPCGLCPLSFPDESMFKTHLETHRNDSSCSICGEPCLDWQHLFSHRLHHLAYAHKKCHRCDKRFARDINMEYHFRIKHSTEPFQGIKCKLCMRVYPTAYRLKRHLQTQHSGKKFICDLCSKILKTKQQLSNHIIKHGKKIKYACESCDFSSTSKTSLNHHTLRRHLKTKLYCKFCSRIFVKEETFAKHTCPRSIICSTCGKHFTSQKSHERHVKVHSDARPYKCNRCPATYKYKGNLTIHMNRHDGKRTHCCDYCPAKFYTHGVLNKHVRTHTGEKPFVCKVCNRGFTGGHNLKVHMKVHGEDLVVKKGSTNIVG